MLAENFTKIRARLLTGAICLLISATSLPLTNNAQIPAAKPCFDFSGNGRTSFATVGRGTATTIFI